MPSKLPQQIMTVGSQKDNRWLATFTDQHKSARFPNGRPWWGYLEVPSEPKAPPSFVAEVQPGDHEDPFGSTWSAPWMPDMKFVTFDPLRARLTINYQAMASAYRLANTEYYRAAAKIANMNNWDAPELYGPISYKIDAIIGPPPQNPKIPEAALAGDPWILGFSDEPNEQLSKLLRGDALQIVGDREPVVSVSNALTMSPEQLQAMIAGAIEAHEQKKASDRMAKARSARKSPSAAPQAA